uniref:Integrin subunit alpha 7 n=1 Tax=Scleropages formosus TaxID=113540 RepID=A0A8C9VQA3_SCLFO
PSLAFFPFFFGFNAIIFLVLFFWVLLLCAAALASFPLALGFNLDTTQTLTKEGEKGSFFGFSLALHQQLSPISHSWILVGAPRARGLGALQGSRPGALYRCPITAEEYDCERVDIDGEVRPDRESKDNQWLGVTVRSQGIGGKVVTCAHLYELRQRVNQSSETRDPIGRCYVLSEDLTERDDLDGGEWKFCEGRPQSHEQFGFCQQGLAVSFTPDKNFILFGAPGTYNWKGLLFMASPVEDALVYKTLEPLYRPTTFEDVAQNSYLGFSVDSAKDVLSRGHLTFVAGAPRANHTGAVVLLRKDNVYRLVPQHILWGEELASSFGYSVATADLNNDGWTDIIVGAPNFFDRKAEIGGAVYVYLNPASHWHQARPIRLNGTHDSMFGLAVTSVGDLDQDGYGDIAVGAPFDGDGKVFIYRGSSSGIDTKTSQVLDGVGVGVKHFGYSISGGLDIDGNSYPDLAVGSLDDQVVLYRSRPVIHLRRDISIEPQNIDLENRNCKVRFEADTERRKLNLPHRISFLGRTASELEYQRSEEVELRGQSQPACKVATFQLQENLRDKLRPISLAITHSIKRARHLGHVAPKHLGPLSPVLSASISSTLHTEVNFLREGCGDDRICQSNLQLSYRFGTRPVNSDLFTPLPIDEDGVPVFSLSDQRSIALEVLVTNMPSDPQRPHEDGDDAHAAQLLVTLPDTLSYSGFRGQQVVCQTNQNGSQAECELGNPLKRDSKVSTLNKWDICFCLCGCLRPDCGLSSISEQSDLAPVRAHAKVVIELPLSISGVARPHQLFFSGTVKGESAMVTLDDVGSPVEFEFTVTNPGQFLQTLGSAFLNIMWPHELANGKWLLYPTDVHFQGHPNTHCTPATLNPLSLTDSHPRHHHEHHQDHHHHHDDLRQDTHHTDCLLGSARCLLLQCPLHSISGSAVLSVQARLWNATFLEEFSSVSALELLVRANITVKSSIKHLVLRDAASQVSVMIYPEHGVADQHGIPWWIILIAVLAGILVLALLVCILWKCGFFQRAQYKDTVPQYHAIKIPREDRPQFQNEKTGTLRKKDWATHWSDGTS